MLKKKELRKKEIENKLSKTIDLIESVSKIIPKNFDEFKKNDITRDAIYKRIESSIQNLIDVCYIINSDLRLGMPEEEDDIFKNIEKKGIFSKKVIEKLIEIKKFRNILVHKYGEINDEKAYEDINEGLSDFEMIINEIDGFLKKWH